MQEGQSALGARDAARLVGPGAADRDGRGNVNVGDGGVAFVLAAAAASPGGADTVRHPRALVVWARVPHPVQPRLRSPP